MVNDVREEEKKQRLYILQEHITQQAMQFGRRMQGTVQRILVKGTSRKNVMNYPDTPKTNLVVNFEGAPSMIGKFVDVKIVYVYLNSLRGVLLRTEDQMALRSHESPASVMPTSVKKTN